jgi:hypothetical protein
MLASDHADPTHGLDLPTRGCGLIVYLTGVFSTSPTRMLSFGIAGRAFAHRSTSSCCTLTSRRASASRSGRWPIRSRRVRLRRRAIGRATSIEAVTQTDVDQSAATARMAHTALLALVRACSARSFLSHPTRAVHRQPPGACSSAPARTTCDARRRRTATPCGLRTCHSSGVSQSRVGDCVG